jgi:hypothetical protein
MNSDNDAISDSSNQDGEEGRKSQRRNMLPVNVWGENWRLKLREMMEDQDKSESEIANTSSPHESEIASPQDWGGTDKSGTNKVEHVPNAKPKKTKVSRSSTIGKDKYGQRLHGFLNNPLVRALRAPEVWEEAVKIWTNNYGKPRFCVVMVSNYIVIVIVIDII